MLAGANWVPDFSAFDDRRLPYVYNPEVKVLDDDGKVLQDFFPYSQTLGGVVLSSGEAPAGISIGRMPCSNCNNGSECPSDMDHDGLKDVWETRGFDANCDGTVDVDLPNLKGAGRGTNPQHKDILLEIDFSQRGSEPTQAMVRVAKATMRAAPFLIGNTPNFDGVPGINLWIDTGTMRDPFGFEPSCRPGVTPCAGPCDDGVDNDGDGVKDGTTLTV